MEEIYGNTHYKSGWIPLTREETIGVVSTYLNSENYRQKEKSIERGEMPAEITATPEHTEQMKKLSEISENIDTLNVRIKNQSETIDALNNMIQNQQEQINGLINLIDEKLTAVRKSTVWLSRK